jgi:serine/threonine protein kinase
MPGPRVHPLHATDPDRLGVYQLAGRLGSGGMGVVYLGHDPRGGYVAIKLVHTALAGDPEFRDRFRSEVDRARQVPSFCTAEVLDADLAHWPPYLVVEYVDGPSLAETVADHGPLSPAHLHSVAVGVATALAGIHGAGVIHRDLKPENVLLAPGSPKVIDFGIARAFEATSRHTRTDQMVGTVAYMAPERFSAELEIELTAAADVFAWGCVVAYAGTGRTPFRGDSPPATAARILTQQPQLSGIAEPLRSMVALSLAKEPRDRPTARELLDMLLGAAPVPSPVIALPTPPPTHTPVGGGRRRPRGGKWLVALAVLVVLAGTATVASLLRVGDSSAGETPVAASPSTGLVSSAPATSAPASVAPAPAPARTPTRKPTPAEPRGGEPIIQDPLGQPGQWLDSEIREEHANCFTKGVMRAARVDRGTFQCAGPKESIEDDFGVAVSTALLSPGSCAAIWFHWTGGDTGGQVLRLCEREVSIAYDRPADRRVLGRIALTRPVTLKKTTRIHMTIRDRTVDVWRDGGYAGAIRLPADGPTAGQVQLGISVEALDGTPPYTATFADVDIRSLGD